MLTVPQPSHFADILQSWLYGKVIERLEPEAMALGESHGYETASSKRFMRQSVMLSDLIGVSAPALACLRAAQHSISQGNLTSCWIPDSAGSSTVGLQESLLRRYLSRNGRPDAAWCTYAASATADRSRPLPIQLHQPRSCGDSRPVTLGHLLCM